MTPTRRIRRKLETAIAWMPASDSHHVVARLRNARIPSLCFTQAAILDLEARLAASPSPVPFGLLCGALCVTPKTDEEYLLVDEVTPAAAPTSSSDPLAELADELRSLSRDVASRGRLVQGWYLGGMEDDLRLDPEALSVHLSIFPQPQHVLLLRNAASGRVHGGVFRYEQMTDRLFPIPFLELLPDNARAGAKRRTAVRWTNYAASEPVEALAPNGEPAERERSTPSPRDSVRFPPVAPEPPVAPRFTRMPSRSEAASPCAPTTDDVGMAGAAPSPVLVTFPVLLEDAEETSIGRSPAGRLVRVIGAVLLGLVLGVATYVAYGSYAVSR